MNQLPDKDRHVGLPVEKHVTAAWAGVETAKPASNVSIPPADNVIEAKDYVDDNQK